MASCLASFALPLLVPEPSPFCLVCLYVIPCLVSSAQSCHSTAPHLIQVPSFFPVQQMQALCFGLRPLVQPVQALPLLLLEEPA